MTTLQEWVNALKAGEARVINQLVDDTKRDGLLPFDLSQEPDWGDLSVEKMAYFVSSLEWICDHLSQETTKPQWFYDEKFCLETPLFAMNAQGMLRLVLMIESPVEFKMRNIYVSKNVLERV